MSSALSRIAGTGPLRPETVRAEPPATWRGRLLAAGPAALEAALERNDLEEADLRMLLRNRRAGSDLLRRIAGDFAWTRSYAVKRGLVTHPNLPLPDARRLLPHLHWKELAEVADNLRLHPVLRRKAEELLRVRQQDLSLGEKISLARRAPRGAIPGLISGAETQVLAGLLWNPRLLERDALAMVRDRKLSADALALVARHPRWSTSRRVRMALAENPRTPVPIALDVVRRLSTNDLRRVARNAKVPKLIRVGAGRALQEPPRRRSAGWGFHPDRA